MALLDNIHIASPCAFDWTKMDGDDRVRTCTGCKKNVYNISEMTLREAESLLREHAGNLCVRIHRRKDGTVITDDCPVGLRKLRAQARRLRSAVSVAVAWLTSIFTIANGVELRSPTSNQTETSRFNRPMVTVGDISASHVCTFNRPLSSDGPCVLMKCSIRGCDRVNLQADALEWSYQFDELDTKVEETEPRVTLCANAARALDQASVKSLSARNRAHDPAVDWSDVKLPWIHETIPNYLSATEQTAHADRESLPRLAELKLPEDLLSYSFGTAEANDKTSACLRLLPLRRNTIIEYFLWR